MKSDIAMDNDWDAPGDDDRQTATRRLFSYSNEALHVAASVERIFVNHPDFKSALQACDRVFQLGRELTIAQGVIVAGDTGVGKTGLIRYFRSSLPSSTFFEEGLGALVVRLPKRPNVGHLVAALLRQLRYPFPNVSHQTLSLKRDVLREAMRQKGTRLLFVDEAHHLQSQAKVRQQDLSSSTITDFLRELVDEAQIGLCLTGTSALLRLDELDPHLSSRITARYSLQNFKCDSAWHAFARAFKRQCRSFDLSILEDKVEAERLHAVTVGNPRGFKRLLTEAVLVAADAACVSVQVDHVRLALSRVNGEVVRPGCPYAQ